ncbi:hypothetical protein DPMN_078669 [Dreissena polymorpha]|uniref:Uncharacterized protein n=1 Tax=Dreissena polymorpha TaxID=45954 RepID=A0A9D3YR13_DREPO|nr:hypothetical protein DPMN_078669 [Dreissena polymorpha]
MNSAWIDARQYETFCNASDGLPKLFESKAKHTVLWVMQRVKERPVRGTYNGNMILKILNPICIIPLR